MIVVSDTSVLCYLILLDRIDVLVRRFGEALVPEEVIRECLNPASPAKLRAFVQNPPAWLRIRPAPIASIAGLERLDPGESAAIRLALVHHADLLLIDERLGRKIAANAGLAVSGTLGILAEAAKRRWLDFDETVNRLLTETNFRVSPEVIAELRSLIKIAHNSSIALYRSGTKRLARRVLGFSPHPRVGAWSSLQVFKQLPFQVTATAFLIIIWRLAGTTGGLREVNFSRNVPGYQRFSAIAAEPEFLPSFARECLHIRNL